METRTYHLRAAEIAKMVAMRALGSYLGRQDILTPTVADERRQLLWTVKLALTATEAHYYAAQTAGSEAYATEGFAGRAEAAYAEATAAASHYDDMTRPWKGVSGAACPAWFEALPFEATAMRTIAEGWGRTIHQLQQEVA